MPATAEKKSRCSVIPFGIEIDHPRNSPIALQSIIGMKVRSRTTATRTVKNRRTGHESVPIDQSMAYAGFPTIPGMQLFVDPANLEYKVVDPLRDDRDLCDKLIAAMKQQGTAVSDTMNGMPERKGTLDVHRIKTLCREMLWILDAKQANVIKGVKPDLEDIQDLDGEFLLNPGSRITNSQPRYECDWEEWVTQLNRGGG